MSSTIQTLGIALLTCPLVCAAKENGPPLIYDHQIVYDPKTSGIIVFGGRNVNASEMCYSGLYHYDIEENIWIRLRYVGWGVYQTFGEWQFLYTVYQTIREPCYVPPFIYAFGLIPLHEADDGGY